MSEQKTPITKKASFWIVMALLLFGIIFAIVAITTQRGAHPEKYEAYSGVPYTLEKDDNIDKTFYALIQPFDYSTPAFKDQIKALLNNIAKEQKTTKLDITVFDNSDKYKFETLTNVPFDSSWGYKSVASYWCSGSSDPCEILWFDGSTHSDPFTADPIIEALVDVETWKAQI